MSCKIPYICALFCILKVSSGIETEIASVAVPQHDIEVQVNSTGTFQLNTRNIEMNANTIVMFWPQHEDIISLDPTSINLLPGNQNYSITIHARTPGHSEITSNSTPHINTKNVYARVTVFKQKWIDTASLIVGWIYFIAWSISFYPQIYYNWERKSVVGLNFDFQSLNILGFILYSVFNIGLYSIPEIKVEYANRHPRGLNPVQVNDIVFGVHAAAACALTIVQCCIYERGEQKVSLLAKLLIGGFGAALVVAAVISATNVLHWLDFLYFCSYVKLTITLIKYMPQAYMNYQRKSTIGWSIGNIFLDFTGGLLSMLQMILLSYNYDDWASIFGDPTKFGLGLFSVIFDIFFMIQHYILYRDNNSTDSYDVTKEDRNKKEAMLPEKMSKSLV